MVKAKSVENMGELTMNRNEAQQGMWLGELRLQVSQ